MADVRVAIPDKPRIRPAFTVKKLDGKASREILSFDKSGKKVVNTVEEDAGYLVKFPKGHSIRVRSDADMKRLGFDRTVPLINDEGDVVGGVPNMIFDNASEE